MPISDLPTLIPYALPTEVSRMISEVAEESDVLVLGEWHWTREVAELVAGLLPSLGKQGYQTLALEVPHTERANMEAWANGVSSVPNFYAMPTGDGRGNAQMLALVQLAVRDGWKVLCFDVAFINSGNAWSARVTGMADNLLSQWQELCPEAKVLAVCGNLHARLMNHAPPDHWQAELWPAFAAPLAQKAAGRTVRSIKVRPLNGASYNMELQQISGDSASEPTAKRTPSGDFTLELDLPYVTPATFLADQNLPLTAD